MGNTILSTDSYKLTHYDQYPQDCTGVYSYFEARNGAKYPYTVFFGLQAIIQKYLGGVVVDRWEVGEAADLAEKHFGNKEAFNFEGWMHIVNDHGGKLPIRIKAVPEGTVVPINNVLMTVENTCDKCYWLTNALESLLTHVWYPTTVATLSYDTKRDIEVFLVRTADSLAGLDFMLHDFGYRGASSEESAAIGGAGHLVNFKGTDTLPAMLFAIEHYSADFNTLGFSVPATEHSVMTAGGRHGEEALVKRLIKDHPTGILSVVADSYDYYWFVAGIVSVKLKEEILARDGVFVVRPDSTTPEHKTPAELVVWTLEHLWGTFGGAVNSKLYKVLDPHIRILWGDGIDPDGIHDILMAAQNAGFSAENLVFGMGGGLLQKVNRDTQRFAFKCSAQKSADGWRPVQKDPLDATKKSKAGRLALQKDANGRLHTVNEALATNDQLELVFENGALMRFQEFDDIRILADS